MRVGLVTLIADECRRLYVLALEAHPHPDRTPPYGNRLSSSLPFFLLHNLSDQIL